MPDDDADEQNLEEFEGSSVSFRRKANALVHCVKKLMKKGKRSPLVIYLNTDGDPIAVEIDALVIETYDGIDGADVTSDA